MLFVLSCLIFNISALQIQVSYAKDNATLKTEGLGLISNTTLDALLPYTLYDIKVRAKTSKGLGSTGVVTAKTGEAGWLESLVSVCLSVCL